MNGREGGFLGKRWIAEDAERTNCKGLSNFINTKGTKKQILSTSSMFL